MIWDSINGMRNLHDVLTNDLGLDLTGWTLLDAIATSADGRTIVGDGINPSGKDEAWIARLGPTDSDGDGIDDDTDNCLNTPNSNQIDTDDDGDGDACDDDDDDDTILDAVDNCPLDANSNQADADGDGAGDVCDEDSDGDGILDADDACVPTATGEVVDTTGCSIADLCPCENEWKNHGAYVSCVARASGDFVAAGLITEADKDTIVSAAAESDCGKKN